jgi:hypothetical protein
MSTSINLEEFSPVAGDAFVWDNANQLWVIGQVAQTVNGKVPAGGVVALDVTDMDDVNVSSVAKGDALSWNGTDFINRPVAYRIGSNAINKASTNTTVEEILHTWTIGANELPIGGRLRIQFLVETNNNANLKRFRVRAGGIGGTDYFNVNLTNSICTQVITVDIYANGATNSQVGHGLLTTLRSGSTTAAKTTSAVNTTASWTVVLTSLKATGTDTVTVLFADCYLFP